MIHSGTDAITRVTVVGLAAESQIAFRGCLGNVRGENYPGGTNPRIRGTY